MANSVFEYKSRRFPYAVDTAFDDAEVRWRYRLWWHEWSASRPLRTLLPYSRLTKQYLEYKYCTYIPIISIVISVFLSKSDKSSTVATTNIGIAIIAIALMVLAKYRGAIEWAWFQTDVENDFEISFFRNGTDAQFDVFVRQFENAIVLARKCELATRSTSDLSSTEETHEATKET